MAWTAPSTWVAGAVLTAAQLNQQLRDNLKAIGDPWTSYTPTWTASTTNPTLGNGTITGAYMQAGKLVHFRFRIVVGTTTTAGSGAYSFGLPVPAVVGFNHAFAMSALLFDSSASARYTRSAYLSTTSAFVLTDASGVNVTHAVPYAPANLDIIAVAGTYEAA